MNKFNFNKLTPFKWFVLENFPFIEADFDALTEWQLFCKLGKEINKIINSENTLGTQMENVTNAFIDLQNYINNYFDNLDVQEEINTKLNEMVADGTLAEIINQEIFSELNNKIDENTRKIEENSNNINTNIEKITLLNNKLNINSIKNVLMLSPLLVIQKIINNTKGYMQGMTATYNDDGSYKNIYFWVDYNTFARLYKVTCGSNITGTGWSYSYIDNVPNVHGSCLSYKDGFLYVGDVENGNGIFLKYNLLTDTYEYVNISNVINSYILGIVWDSKTQTFLICADGNKKMYILDENYNLISQYEHNVEWLQNEVNYTMQGYDYQNGYEYRTVSSNNVNYLLIIDTSTGNLLKICELAYINGEIEDISINNGFAIFSINAFNDGYSLIYMNCIAESFIGGFDDNSYLTQMQARKFIGWNNFPNYAGKSLQQNPILYYENNYNNTDIVRYVGTGTQENPIKSGLALASWLCAFSHCASQFFPTIKILQSSNTDDNGLYIIGKHNIDRILIEGNNNSICVLTLEGLSRIDILNLNIVTGNTRRNNGRLTIFGCYGNNKLRGTINCIDAYLENNTPIDIYDTGLICSNNAYIRRNVIRGFNKIQANSVQDLDNIKGQ